MKRIAIFGTLLFACVLSVAQTTNQVDDKGRKQGKWMKYDEKERLVYIGTFKDDQPQGTFRYYYPFKDTLVRSIMEFRKGGKEAFATNFHENGMLMAKGKYLNQKKDSVWSFYDIEGFILSKEAYKDDKKNGLSTVYYQDGKVFSEYSYKDDLKDGPAKEYYDDGSVKMEAAFLKGKKHGKFTYYYPDGKIAASGLYRDGMKHLVWISNDKTGKAEPREVYDMGNLLEGKAAEDFLKKQQAANTNTNTTTPDKKGSTGGTKKTGTTGTKTNSATGGTTKPKTGGTKK